MLLKELSDELSGELPEELSDELCGTLSAPEVPVCRLQFAVEGHDEVSQSVESA
jgi:hypothetical protein